MRLRQAGMTKGIALGRLDDFGRRTRAALSRCRSRADVLFPQARQVIAAYERELVA